MHNKYLYSLYDYSLNSHTSEFLANQIENVIKEIGNDKFVGNGRRLDTRLLDLFSLWIWWQMNEFYPDLSKEVENNCISLKIEKNYGQKKSKKDEKWASLIQEIIFGTSVFIGFLN